MIKNLKRILFSLIIFLIPINLGKHFISVNSYVGPQLVDYLIPTIWLTDLLIFVLLVLWVVGGGLKRVKNKNLLRFITVFIAVLIPSVLIAPRIEASAYFFLSLVLKIMFMLFVSEMKNIKDNFLKIVKILSSSVFLLSILALGQWFKQSSVFNNYLFFGEQPYSLVSSNVAKINLFGRLKIPPYATFRHPNIFAGFLSTVLVWIYFQLSYYSKSKKNSLLRASFILGFLSLILTFSQVAFVSFLLSILFLILIKKFGKKGVLFSIFITFLILVTSLNIFVTNPLIFEGFYNDPSFFRRVNLLKSAYLMVKANTFFGVGLNNFTVVLSDYLPLSQVLVFNQPVHNIFMLIFSEAGIFTLASFITLFIYSLFTLLKQDYGIAAVLFVTLLNFIILGSFDHYLLTAHQTQTIFWLTLGLSLAYTKVDENQ